MVQSCVLFGTLAVHSIEDMRDKKITVTITLFSGILGIMLHLLFQNQSIFEMLAGMFTGVLIWMLSVATGGKIGAGDGIVFMLTGLYLGWTRNLLLMFLSFSFAGIFGVFLIVFLRYGSRERIPFVPFLLLGYTLMMIM